MTTIAPKSHAATVFSDSSENSTVGTIPGATDPTIGSWDFTSNDAGSVVLTRTGATVNGPAAAFSGSNYLQIGRGPNNQVAQVGAVFDNPVDVTTNSLHAEFQMFFNQAQFNAVAMGFQDAQEYIIWGTQSNTLVPLLFGDNTGVAASNLWYWNGGPDFVPTAENLVDNAWNEVTMDWDPVTAKFTVGLNGVSWEAPAVWGTATSISRLQFFPAWTTGNMFIDDFQIESTAIPEPLSASLAATGFVGLLAYGRRKRRSH